MNEIYNNSIEAIDELYRQYGLSVVQFNPSRSTITVQLRNRKTKKVQYLPCMYNNLRVLFFKYRE